MEIGILKETYSGETRVPLIPFAVGELIRQGNRVVIQSEAGLASGFEDQAYREAGATVVYSAEEVISRSELILKVYPPSWEEYQRLEEEQILFSFLQLSHATKKNLELLIEKKVTAIGFEAIEDQAGNLIILQVMVLDKDVSRLRALEEKTQFRIASAVATPYNICRFVPIADVLIGAVFIQMESTPHILDEELIRKMRPHSVFMDISIDQGGCSTTSRPTTIIEPVYLKEGVIHFCVPNIPALVPRTATIALSNILLPFLEQMAEKGPQKILSSQKSFARGFYTYNGFCLKEKIADHLGLPFVDMKT